MTRRGGNDEVEVVITKGEAETRIKGDVLTTNPNPLTREKPMIKGNN